MAGEAVQRSGEAGGNFLSKYRGKLLSKMPIQPRFYFFRHISGSRTRPRKPPEAPGSSQKLPEAPGSSQQAPRASQRLQGQFRKNPDFGLRTATDMDPDNMGPTKSPTEPRAPGPEMAPGTQNPDFFEIAPGAFGRLRGPAGGCQGLPGASGSFQGLPGVSGAEFQVRESAGKNRIGAESPS